MNKDRIDEQKLINTLKGLLKQFLPSESLPMEKQVNRYLNIKFKNLSEITNSDNNGIFYLKDGKTKFFYNKNRFIESRESLMKIARFNGQNDNSILNEFTFKFDKEVICNKSD